MSSVLHGPSVGYPRIDGFNWRILIAIILLIAVGALISLLAGPDPAGVDGMAGTWVGAP